MLIRVAEQQNDSSLISRRVLRSHAVTLVSPSYIEKHGKPQKPDDLPFHRVITYSGLKQPNQWSYRDSDDNEIQIQVNSCSLTNSSQNAVIVYVCQLKALFDYHVFCSMMN